MSIAPQDLAKILRILEKIDSGDAEPQFPGRIGRFLRQYRYGRAQIDEILSRSKLSRRVDGAVSGAAIGAIEVHPILETGVNLLCFPLGEVADTLAISEELGCLVNFVMWLKGPIANAAYNLLRENRGIRLLGDYRWSPLARLTPGEARLDRSDPPVLWQNARCMKAVAEDLMRPPHALEYILDYRIGPPGIKYFRCVCAVRRADAWLVLPGLGKPTPLKVGGSVPREVADVSSGNLALLLVYREPWLDEWTIAKGAAIDADAALAHSITWADFQRELLGLQTDAAVVAGVRNALREIGLQPTGIGEPNLTRQLRPVARNVLGQLHGVS